MLSRLEHVMNCHCSRVAANFGAFLSQLARVYKVYLAAFSLPRLWEMGYLCHSIMMLEGLK